MFDKLEDLLIRYEELMSELSEPDVANNPERFRKLMKEQSDILPIVRLTKNTNSASRTSKIRLLCWRKNLTKRCVNSQKRS